jgi:hypothetical protein
MNKMANKDQNNKMKLFVIQWTGVNVIVAIFGETIGVFLENQSYDHFLHMRAVLPIKNI